MTEQAARYDRIAEGYARWWAPVLAPAVAELLDELAPRLDGGERLIDIGTGTGQLALNALGRWRQASIVGVDASTGMCAVADAEADRILPPTERARFRTMVAQADRLPFPDGAFDAALSSFVFQLVPRRARALREARRVLRPGGILAFVTWLMDDRVFVARSDVRRGARRARDRSRDDDGRPGDLPSVERAAGELRHAGFSEVAARPGTLEHRFTVDGYIAFLVEFDEETLFAEFEPDLRADVISTLRTRLSRLSPDQMAMRYPIVFASGRRSKALRLRTISGRASFSPPRTRKTPPPAPRQPPRPRQRPPRPRPGPPR